MLAILEENDDGMVVMSDVERFFLNIVNKQNCRYRVKQNPPEFTATSPAQSQGYSHDVLFIKVTSSVPTFLRMGSPSVSMTETFFIG